MMPPTQHIITVPKTRAAGLRATPPVKPYDSSARRSEMSSAVTECVSAPQDT